jgi:hypothetical protein
MPDASDASQYLASAGVPAALAAILAGVVSEMPDDPVEAIGRALIARGAAQAAASTVRAAPEQQPVAPPTPQTPVIPHTAVSEASSQDPRHQLFDFFNSGDERGPSGVLRNNSWNHSGETVTDFFSVWRPTSMDAIEMMMSGAATGKGLNVKGKSAKKGAISGFVPFLQISEEAHKAKCGTSPPYAMMRVFYRNEDVREAAQIALQRVLDDMLSAAHQAHEQLVSDATKEADGAPEEEMLNRTPPPRLQP